MKPPSRQCVIKSCPNRNAESKSLNFQINYFRFPTDEKLMKKWKEKSNLKDNKLIKSARICSLHFREKDFDRWTIPGKKLLKDNAVPSLRLKANSTSHNDSNNCVDDSAKRYNTRNLVGKEINANSTSKDTLRNKESQGDSECDDDAQFGIPPIDISFEEDHSNETEEENIKEDKKSEKIKIDVTQTISSEEQATFQILEDSCQLNTNSSNSLINSFGVLTPVVEENYNEKLIECSLVSDACSTSKSLNSTQTSQQEVEEEVMTKEKVVELVEFMIKQHSQKISEMDSDESNDPIGSQYNNNVNYEIVQKKQIENNSQDLTTPEKDDHETLSNAIKTEQLDNDMSPVKVKRVLLHPEEGNVKRQKINVIEEEEAVTLELESGKNNEEVPYSQLNIEIAPEPMEEEPTDIKDKQLLSVESKNVNTTNNATLIINRKRHNCQSKLAETVLRRNNILKNGIMPPDIEKKRNAEAKIICNKPQKNGLINLTRFGVERRLDGSSDVSIPKAKFDDLIRKYDSLVKEKRNAEMFSSQIIESMKKTMEKRELEMEKLKQTQVDLLAKINKIESAVNKMLTPNQIKLLCEERDISWSNKEMILAFALRYLSRKCYHFLCQKLNYPLPGITTVQEWLSAISQEQCHRLIHTVENSVSLPANVEEESFDQIVAMFLADDCSKGDENINLNPESENSSDKPVHSYIKSECVSYNSDNDQNIIILETGNHKTSYEGSCGSSNIIERAFQDCMMMQGENDDVVKIVQSNGDMSDINYSSPNVIVVGEPLDSNMNSPTQLKTEQFEKFNNKDRVYITISNEKDNVETSNEKPGENYQLYQSDQFLKQIIGHPYDGRKAIALKNYEMYGHEENINNYEINNFQMVEPAEHSYAVNSE